MTWLVGHLIGERVAGMCRWRTADVDAALAIASGSIGTWRTRLKAASGTFPDA